MRFLTLIVFLTACVSTESIRCDDGSICPRDKICAPAGGCLDPKQIAACEGMPDGMDCRLDGIGDGLCRAGVCVITKCGDGVIDIAEACDDGNDIDSDACTNDCALPTCGDAILQVGEGCDDGAANADDRACTSRCLVAICGDGLLRAGVEECDAASANADSDACTTACLRNVCGDGHPWTDVEACDDGNVASADGCRGDCRKVEVCEDSIVDANEACDDGNLNPADRCDACVATTWEVTTLTGGTSDAIATPIGNPNEVVADFAGNLYFADTVGNRIRRIDAVTGAISTVAGTGEGGTGGDGSIATSARFSQPSSVAVDGSGNLFIADTFNSAIRRVDAISHVITTIPITPSLLLPAGVAVDGFGNLLVADTNHHVVKRVDRLSGVTTIIAGTGTSGNNGDGQATTRQLSFPTALTVDASGQIYIADRGNHRVMCFHPSNQTVTRFAGTGTPGFTDNMASELAQLTTPGAMVTSGNDVYIADRGNNRIRKVHSGVISTVAGNGFSAFGSDGGLATLSTLDTPGGVALDLQGALVIADTSHHRIRRVDPTTQVISTIAGTGARGAYGGVAATSALLIGPSAIAADAAGNVYIAQPTTAQILRVTPTGDIAIAVGTGESGATGAGGPGTAARIGSVYGIAVDAAGNVYFADSTNNRIGKYDPVTTIVTTFAGGDPGFSGDGGPAISAKFASPYALAFDPTGNLIVSDLGNNRLRRITPTGSMITTIAGNGTYGIGGDGGSALTAQIAASSIAVDAAGNIYVGDSFNNVVRRIDTTNTITRFAGDAVGTAGFDGDGGAATAALLSRPQGIAIDGTAVLIADDANHRVRRVANGVITTLTGGDSALFDGDGGPFADGLFSNPISIAVSGGTILVADATTNMVRKLAGTTITTIAGLVAPEGIGALAASRLGDPQAMVLAGSIELVAGGATGTVQLIRDGRVTAVVGRYPQDAIIADSARYRGRSFGDVGGVAYDAVAKRIYLSTANQISTVDASDANPANWTIATLTGAGIAAAFSDGDYATARFRRPTGLVLDSAMHVLFVVDSGNHAIRQIDLVAQQVTTVVGVPGQFGFSGDGALASNARLSNPQAIARCANGDMFIADTGNHRVRRIDSTGTISSVLGDGTPGSSAQGAPARTYSVDAPRGIACDALGNVFVTSSSTLRLLPATDAHVVDGDGPVETIYGLDRSSVPEAITSCLTGVAVVDATRVQIADACTGLLVELARTHL